MILNDVPKILAVAGAAARIRIKHNVALRCHPLEFVIEYETVSSVWSTVDVQDEWIFFGCIEVGRLLYPRLNTFAVKRLIPDFFRFRQLELREQVVIEVG